MTDIHKLSGAFAVDALDDLERARFEQHLADCEDCRAEVTELRETAARLASTIEVAPPAGLRESVLAGIAQVRPLPPESPTATPTASPTPESTASGSASPVPDGTPLAEGPGVSALRPRQRWLPLLVAAALAVVAGIGVTVWQPWQDEEVPRLTAAERVLQAPDAETVALDLGEAGRAKVVRSVSEDRAVIVTEDMVSAPEGQDYELWFQTPEDDMVPAGLMPDDPDQTLVLEGSASAATAVGITVEPDGGSEEPTSDPIALFDFDEAT